MSSRSTECKIKLAASDCLIGIFIHFRRRHWKRKEKRGKDDRVVSCECVL